MSIEPLHFQWEWHLQSSPHALWPLVSDTNRFNRDTGAGALEKRTGEKSPANARRLLRIQSFNRLLEWEEDPYEWVQPFHYSAARRFTEGFLSEAKSTLELYPEGSGTRLIYHLWITPKSRLIQFAAMAQLRLNSGRIFERVFKRYDQQAQAQTVYIPLAVEDITFVPGGRERLAEMNTRLKAEGAAPALAEQLTRFIETADAVTLAHIRPYALADGWNVQRRSLLDLCLVATRVGLLNLRWDVLCPNCRGAKYSTPTLGDLQPQVHCDMCNIDFSVNFERSVELTFQVNPAIREVESGDFCIAGPQTTPHVAIQQLLRPGEKRTVKPALERGRYRLRALNLRGGQYITLAEDGPAQITLTLADTWPDEEWVARPDATITLVNATSDEQLAIFERFAWSDQSVTAAEVTTMQLFRDLFSREALRPGDQISVGSLTIVFTDLRGSTNLYRDIGDAPAFGLVMSHFDVLKAAIAGESGAIVKTIGDAVMAVFPRPELAVKAMLNAQRALAQPGGSTPPLKLKVGIHSGACIAVTLNDRLDYFGSTVNLAARLEGQSSGDDLIISDAIYNDLSVRHYLHTAGVLAEPFQTELKGFGGDQFALWRVRPSHRPESPLYRPASLFVPADGETTHELLL